MNRTLLPAAFALALLGGVALESAEENRVVWTASSIGPAYAQFQSLSCATLPTSCPVFSITGAGGLTAQDDVYAFMHRTLQGDGYLVARISEIRGVSSALAGLSIRGSLSRGAAQLSLLRTVGGGLVVRKRARANLAVSQSTSSAVSGAGWLRLERRGQTISLAQSTDGAQWTSIPGATIDLPLTAYAGLAVSSQRPDAMASATMSSVQLVAQSSLPDGWTKVDLDPAAHDSVVQIRDSTWTMAQLTASATLSDAPSFVSRRVIGNAEISIRLQGLTAASATAGLMVRGSLDPSAPFALWRSSPTGQRTVQRRLVAGVAPTTTTVGSSSMPGWLKLVRQAAVVSLFHSVDGQSWTLLRTEALDLPDAVYIGVALSKGTAWAGTVVFDNMRIAAVSANELPTISLTSPLPGRSVYEGDTLTIAATAADRDDRVEAVEFFVDGRRVGTDTAAPYLSSWIADGVGSHEVTALARDSDGAVVRTGSVSVSVLARTRIEHSGGSTGGTTPGTSTWRLVFVPSADHDRTVDRYTAEIWTLNSLDSSLVSFRDLGRPAVVGGECAVDLTAAIAVLPSGPYQIVVRALDDATRTRSDGAAFNFVR